jgi:hypothetical protein
MSAWSGMAWGVVRVGDPLTLRNNRRGPGGPGGPGTKVTAGSDDELGQGRCAWPSPLFSFY